MEKQIMTPQSNVFNMDCMEGLRAAPDKFWDLAIVDIPYGIEDKISRGGGSHTKNTAKFHQLYSENGKSWDKAIAPEYFIELQRVSVNQIIWGANYYNMPPCRCFIIWDKVRYIDNYSSLEYAWTSFDEHAREFTYCGNAGFILKADDAKIHPTQKPIALYQWLLKTYAKFGDRILDTHMGSQSSRIASYKMNHPFWGYEIDKQYFDEGCKRFEQSIAEPLFDQPKTEQGKLL